MPLPSAAPRRRQRRGAGGARFSLGGIYTLPTYKDAAVPGGPTFYSRMTIQLAVAQFSPKKGDYAHNIDRIGALFAQVDGLTPRPNLLVLPESATSGYFVEGGVRDVAVTAGTLARDLNEQYRAKVSAPHQLDLTIGFYEVWQN